MSKDLFYFANATEEAKAPTSEGKSAPSPEQPPKSDMSNATGTEPESFFSKFKKKFGFANTKKVKVKKEDKEEEQEVPTTEDDALEDMENCYNERAALRKALAAANEKIEAVPADAATAAEALKLATSQVVELQAQLGQAKEASAANEALLTEQDKTLSAYVDSMATAAEKVESTTKELTAANEKLTKAQNDFANERTLRAKPLIEDAIKSGKITLAERPTIEASFVNEEFDAAATKLAAHKQAMKTETQTGGDLGARSSASGDPKAAAKRFREMVNEHMSKNTNLTYDEAYLAMAKTKEGKPLFDAVQSTRESK